MRAYMQGGGYVVEVDRDEVDAFASEWPCSNLTVTSGKEFVFSASNGDILDAFTLSRGRRYSTEADDGPALAALADDACRFGAQTLGLTDVIAVRFPDLAPGAPRP
ncbi:hypothetical protein BHAOGJBA_4475 [Methylobacterium hispanicum]|uniref:Uncharacterized protein n=1 Tax=Methylobacterium hispanicum TaxID=270350 RepID=A0AAV4ZS82_9HYPH|nr:hypothetical protein [Methylobacterium hispanicum]GJD90931.1 hypothetical protein BHAOGJBA_4475 [Methylobacterium hispanicum]